MCEKCLQEQQKVIALFDEIYNGKKESYVILNGRESLLAMDGMSRNILAINDELKSMSEIKIYPSLPSHQELIKGKEFLTQKLNTYVELLHETQKQLALNAKQIPQFPQAEA